MLLFDGDTGGNAISFKGRWRLKNDDVNYRHNRSTNLLFTDSHSENVNRKTLKQDSIKNAPIIWQPADMGPWEPDPTN